MPNCCRSITDLNRIVQLNHPADDLKFSLRFLRGVLEWRKMRKKADGLGKKKQGFGLVRMSKWIALLLSLAMALSACGQAAGGGRGSTDAETGDSSRGNPAAEGDADKQAGESTGTLAEASPEDAVSDTEASDDLSFRILNTGKSDCSIFVSGSSAILIDTADQDDYAHISETLSQLGVESIEAILISHYDKDHIGSAAFLLQDYPVGAIYGPDHSENSDEYESMVKAAQKYHVEFTKMDPGTEKTLAFEGASFFLEAPAEAAYEDDNDYTVITTVSCGDEAYLFLGDALKTRLKEFTGKTEYALVKLPHHGDYYKALGELIGNTAIGCAVICAEENGDTLEEKLTEALDAKGVETLYTWNGDIRFTTGPISYEQSD